MVGERLGEGSEGLDLEVVGGVAGRRFDIARPHSPERVLVVGEVSFFAAVVEPIGLVEFLKFDNGEVAHPSGRFGAPVDGCVVVDDKDAVGGHLEIHLEHVGTCESGLDEGVHRRVRVGAIAAAVRGDDRPVKREQIGDGRCLGRGHLRDGGRCLGCRGGRNGGRGRRSRGRLGRCGCRRVVGVGARPLGGGGLTATATGRCEHGEEENREKASHVRSLGGTPEEIETDGHRHRWRRSGWCFRLRGQDRRQAVRGLRAACGRVPFGRPTHRWPCRRRPTSRGRGRCEARGPCRTDRADSSTT